MKQYVIFLESMHGNAYGYWTGKEYTLQKEKYPVTRDKKGFDVKTYQNKKVAENALKRCIERYAYVVGGEVEEIQSNGQ